MRGPVAVRLQGTEASTPQYDRTQGGPHENQLRPAVPHTKHARDRLDSFDNVFGAGPFQSLELASVATLEKLAVECPSVVVTRS
jgi:hypothetical protein